MASVIVTRTDMLVGRIVGLISDGRHDEAREFFYTNVLLDPNLPDDERSFLANRVGAYDAGEDHILTRDDL